MLPSFISRTSSSAVSAGSGMIPSPIDRTREGTPTPGFQGQSAPYASLNVKKVTLTSKKNWWLGALRLLVFFFVVA